jgi:GNAT superfamily N-acetyltransferase
LSFAYRIRRAVVDDAGIIAHHRASMFYDMKYVDEIGRASIKSASIPPLAEMIEREDYLGWLAESEEKVLASGGIMMRRLLPRPGSLHGGEEAYILNVYTEPSYRRRGLARKLMETALAWCCERGVARVTLHPSEEGENLYYGLGFERTKEMIWKRPQEERYGD